MRKKYFLVVFFILKTILLGAQNLVPNGSFETYDTCPNNQAQLQFAIPWHSATLPGTLDYYNSCSIPFNVPWTGIGYQFAANGNAFAGGYAFVKAPNVANSREYMQSTLIDSLKQNFIYRVSFFVNLCDNCDYAVDKIGVYLSDSAIYSTDTSYLPFIPQIESTTFLSDTANWMQISGYYQAHGGEKYITIGNFRSDTLTDTIRVNSLGWTFAYYYIDSVTVIDCTSTGINEHEQINYTLLQNPVLNSIGFTSPYQIKTATIFNAIGAVVKQASFSSTSNYTLDVADLPRGLYFLQAETKDKRRGVRKFIKQ